MRIKNPHQQEKQNILGIVDESGSLVVKYSYNAYGEVNIFSDTSGRSIVTVNPFNPSGAFATSITFSTSASLYGGWDWYFDPISFNYERWEFNKKTRGGLIMKFEYNDYYKMLVIASIVVMTFSLIGLLINLFLLIKNKGYIKFDKRIIRYLVSIILLAFLFSLGAAPFKHGRHLITEKETDKINVIGEVDRIKKTYGINKYSYDNEANSFAYYIYRRTRVLHYVYWRY